MAQSPETKPINISAETTSTSDAERKASSAISHGTTAERTMTGAGETAARQTSETAQQSTRQFGEVMRQSGAAGAEAAQAGAQLSSETARRTAATVAHGHRQLLEEFADRFETVGRRMAQTMQENASDLRTLVVPPAGATESMRDLQEGVAGLVNGVVQSNVRAIQQIFRMADPAALLDLQRRFMRDYIDTMLQGAGAFARVTRQTADQTLRPIEARIEERQHQQRYGSGGQGAQHHGIVSDVMSSNVQLITPDDTVQQATRMMREEDTGVLPVSEGDRLVGVVTDRDVTLRLVAEGKDPIRTKVREVMSQEVKYVFEDEDLDHVADNMAEQQVRRLPVVNRNKRLVGVVSLGDLARSSRSGHRAGRAMRGVSRDGSQLSSTAAE